MLANHTIAPDSTRAPISSHVRRSPTMGELKSRVRAMKRATAAAKRRIAMLAKLAAAKAEMCDIARQLGVAEQEAGI